MPEISATIKINDAFSGALNKLSAGLSRTQSGFQKLKQGLSGSNSAMGGLAGKGSGLMKSFVGGQLIGNAISKGMSLAGEGVKAMVGELNEASTSWQTFEGNLRQIGRSPEQIESAKKSMQQFAQQTIYSASDMSTTYSQLAAVGTKNTAQLVKGFGGLAATAQDPAQAMKTISEQATQMAAKPKVQWQDFKLMMEQAPAGMSAVAKSMGTNLTGLIQKIQDGKVQTQDFLNAVAKTGTNANFSKMATQYKTVGQAMDGLKETLANKLQPAFDKVGKIGIEWVSNLTDRLSKINGEKLGTNLVNGIKKVETAFNNFKTNFANGFAGSFKSNNLTNMFTALRDAVTNVKNALGGGNFIQTLGSLAGKGLNAVTGIITNIANAIGQMSPGQIKAVGVAVTSLAGSLALLKGMSTVSGVLLNIGKGFKDIKGGLGTAAKGITEIPQAFSKFKTLGNDVSGFFSILKDGAASAQAAKIPDLLGGSTKMGAGISGAVTGIQGAISSLTQLSPLISAAFSPIGAIVAGVTGLIAGAVMAWKSNFMGFRDFVQNTFGTFGQVISSSLSGLGQAFAPIKQAFSQIGPAIQPVISGIKQFITTLGAIAGTGAVVGLAVVVDMFKNIVDGISAAFHALQGFSKGLSGIGSAMNDLKHGDFSFSGLRKAWSDAGKEFGQAKKNFHPFDFSTTSKTITNAINTAKKSFGKQKVKMKVSADTSSVTKKLHNSIKAKKVNIKVKYSTPKMPHLKTIKAPKVAKPKVPTPRMPHLKTIPAPKVRRPNMSGVVSAVRSGMARAAAAARSGGTALSGAVRSAVNAAVAAGRGAAGQMRSVGAMIGAGLAAGMQSQVGAVAAAANALVAAASKAARAKAMIHSPSRLFAQIGDYIGQGMAIGMNNTSNLVAQAGTNLVDAATPIPRSTFNGSSGFSSFNSGAIASNAITPNTVTTSNYQGGNNTNNSRQITIAQGAIQIHSTGNVDYDGERLLEVIETKLQEKEEKML